MRANHPHPAHCPPLPSLYPQQVNFVQNMVYCIERSYRTPDYCVWDRHGNLNPLPVPELHATSIGESPSSGRV